MQSFIQKVLIPLAGLFIVIQLVRPAMTNPPGIPGREISAHEALDPGIAATLARSCNDCHSNRTVWPWYSAVAPASWLVALDVSKGREELNFSEWGAYSTEKSKKLLREICKEISDGEMPELPYTILHPNAKLSPADVNAVCRWSETAAAQVTARDGGGGPGEE